MSARQLAGYAVAGIVGGIAWALVRKYILGECGCGK